MKLGGHPVHVMMIHFPAALLPADLVLSFMGKYYLNASFSEASFYCLAGGVGLGIIAMLTGLIDLLAIPKTNKNAMGAGLVHGFINGVVVLAYAVILWKQWPSKGIDQGIALIVTKAILILSLFVGNYLGGKLIYQYRVGIENQNHEYNS